MERDDDASASEPTASRRAERRARREQERAAEQRPGADDGEGRSRVGPIQYLGEVRAELRKVAWPSGREVVNYSLAVLVMTAVLSGLIFGMDWVIRNLTVQIFG